MLLNWVLIQYHLSTSLTTDKFTDYILSPTTFSTETFWYTIYIFQNSPQYLFLHHRLYLSMVQYWTDQILGTDLILFQDMAVWYMQQHSEITCSWYVLGGRRCRTLRNTYANRAASLSVPSLQPYVGARQPFFRAQDTNPQAPPAWASVVGLYIWRDLGEHWCQGNCTLV